MDLQACFLGALAAFWSRLLRVRFSSLTLDELVIDDERSFRHVSLFDDLKQLLRRDGYRFRVPVAGSSMSWDRVLFLNLTFWSPDEQGDVLESDHIPADVIAHVAWHHLARKALGANASSADGLLFGEAIASAFDLYLVGRLIGHAPESSFLETQVPAMADAAEAAGMSPEAFESLLDEVVADPERAFEDLRQLLFDASSSLVRCANVDAAVEVLDGFSGHRFAPLLHHYELSTWVLYARAYASALEPDPTVRALDQTLRSAKVALAWLEASWVRADATA